MKNKQHQKMNRIPFGLSFLMTSVLLFFSCHTVKKNEVDLPAENSLETLPKKEITYKPLEIFELSNEQITSDINYLMSREWLAYSKLTGDRAQLKMITLLLTCDTIDGRVLDVIVDDQDPDFEIYAKDLTDYFKGFSRVSYVWSSRCRKIREYWLLIYVEDNAVGFEVEVDYKGADY